MSLRAQYNDLMAQRAAHLADAEAALNANNSDAFDVAMAAATAMDGQINNTRSLLEAQEAQAQAHLPQMTRSDREELEDMGARLMRGDAITLDAGRLASLAGLGRSNSTLVSSGSLIQPNGAGTNIHDNMEVIPSIVDQVRSMDLTGLNSYEEPYVVEELEAVGGAVAKTAGTLRTDSDPTFAKAKIAPYELTVTSYVDRNLSRLNPADYASKIQSMALKALRRKLAALIVSGDGQASPDMYGLLNATNTDGEAIYATTTVSELDENSLAEIVAMYGGDDSLGGNARLLLSKNNLIALGKIRGTNEKRRLFEITPDTGNSNTGKIVDGGLVVPYTLVSSMGDATMVYGDPLNYLLGLFGGYTIRVDESYKAGERLNTILGDAMVGGNLVVHHGAVVATIGG